jgi:hypothetical protein
MDQETTALLHVLEQEISDEHIVWPPNDNAVETWKRVSEQKITTHGSAGFLQALKDFEARARVRAANEKTAGNKLLAVALNVFADEATRLAGSIPQSDTRVATSTAPGVRPGVDPAEIGGAVVSAEGMAARDGFAEVGGVTTPTPGVVTHDLLVVHAASPPPIRRPAPAEPNPKGTDVSSSQVQIPSHDDGVPNASLAAVGEADKIAARPMPEVSEPTVSAAVPVVPPPTHPPTAQGSTTATLYANRGDEMLALKDISAARKFYEYAANAGSARAATALARTFDATFIAQLGVVGLKPDKALAAAWYNKAAALEDPHSETQPPTQKAAAAN